MNKFFIILICLISIVSCHENKRIPKNTMSDIYYDIFITDSYVKQDNMSLEGITDSIKVYEPIFEKYGYSSEDYISTVNYYLKQPVKLARILRKTKERLLTRKKELSDAIDFQNGIKRHWALLDSLNIFGADTIYGNAYYRALNNIFFKADTAVLDTPTIDSTLISPKYNAFEYYSMLPSSADRNLSFILKSNLIDNKESDEEQPPVLSIPPHRPHRPHKDIKAPSELKGKAKRPEFRP